MHALDLWNTFFSVFRIFLFCLCLFVSVIHWILSMSINFEVTNEDQNSFAFYVRENDRLAETWSINIRQRIIIKLTLITEPEQRSADGFWGTCSGISLSWIIIVDFRTDWREAQTCLTRDFCVLRWHDSITVPICIQHSKGFRYQLFRRKIGLQG